MLEQQLFNLRLLVDQYRNTGTGAATASSTRDFAAEGLLWFDRQLIAYRLNTSVLSC